MENLAELLEEELAEAFEVKDRKSLHRYVVLLTQQHVDQNTYENQYSELRKDIKATIQAVEQGFIRMDQRFEAFQIQMDARFDAMQKQMDERFDATQKQIESNLRAHEKRFEDINNRFDDMNQRFNGMQKLISIGFVALALIISSFNIVLLLTS